MDGLKKIISEELYKNLLMCEIKIQIKDYKKQGYATQIGKLYADTFKKYNPISVEGGLGIDSDNYKKLIDRFRIDLEALPESSANYFKIQLQNGDLIELIRNASPAVAFVFVNKKNIAAIDNPAELFSDNLADLALKYYSSQNTGENQDN